MFRRQPDESPIIVGVVHLPPLPGSPRYEGSLTAVRERALSDARALQRAGVDAIIVENFGDVPFYPHAVPPETTAALAVVAAAVKDATGEAPVGVNVLRNDARAALAVAAAADLQFIRVNVHASARVTDQGLLEGRAHETLRLRKALDLTRVRILADAQVKHSAPVSERPLAEEACELAQRALADAILVTGSATGDAPAESDVENVRRAISAPVLVASGVTSKNAGLLLRHADGCVIGSALKVDGDPLREVDAPRAAAIVASIKNSCPPGGGR